MSTLLDVQESLKCSVACGAVSEVSFTVDRNTISAIIGPNGAGKTTLFNLITGFLPPSEGNIRLSNNDTTGLPPFKLPPSVRCGPSSLSACFRKCRYSRT